MIAFDLIFIITTFENVNLILNILSILEERTKLLDEVDEDWKEREKRLAAEDESGDNASTEGSEDSRETDDGFFDCISKVIYLITTLITTAFSIMVVMI